MAENYDETISALREEIRVLRRVPYLKRMWYDKERGDSMGMGMEPVQAWAEDMRSLLREMVHARHEAERTGVPALPSETVRAFQERYDAILEQAAGENPLLSVSPDSAEESKEETSAVSLTV